MKKLLSMLLVLIMVFAMFAGCTKDESDPTDNVPTDNGGAGDNNTDGMTMQERIDAGESPLVAYSANNLNDSFLLGIVETVGESLEGYGFTYQYSSCESNTATQIEHLENYLEMGAVCLIVSPMSADTLKDIALNAIGQGCYVIYLGGTPSDYEISGLVNVDHKTVGIRAAEMMLTWVDNTYPDAGAGDVKAALGRYSTTDEMISRTDAIEEVFADDGRVEIVYRKDLLEGTVAEGYNIGEEALTFDADIRLFACFSSSVALGVSNYLMSRSDLNLDEFAAFGTEGNDEASAAVDMSETGESVMRGLIRYGGSNPADALAGCAHDLLFGITQAPDYRFDEIFTHNTVGYTVS